MTTNPHKNNVKILNQIEQAYDILRDPIERDVTSLMQFCLLTKDYHAHINCISYEQNHLRYNNYDT